MGHHLNACDCHFSRHTILYNAKCKIAVSTIGTSLAPDQRGVGFLHVVTKTGRMPYYETLISVANDDGKFEYWKRTTNAGIKYPCNIYSPNLDNEADGIHNGVVREIAQRLSEGDDFR